MKSGAARHRWLTLLFGVPLAGSQTGLPAAPEEPSPAGFVREKLPAMRASVLRPEKWLFCCADPAIPQYQCSPQPFTGPEEYASGVQIFVFQGKDLPADQYAAARIAQFALRRRVLRGWTRKGVPAGPFMTCGLVFTTQAEGADAIRWTYEIVFVANRLTNTLYWCSLYAPTGQWNEVETPGETKVASLRLDPEF